MSLDQLPPRQRLELVLASLCRHLPGQLGGILDDHRFNDTRSPLMRLSDPRWAVEAAAAMSEPEAAWMAEVLWQRWAQLGQPVLEPTARLGLPDEVWIGEHPVRVPVRLVVLGMDAGWTVRWRGSVLDGDPPILFAEPPRSEVWLSQVQVELNGTSQGQPRQLFLRAEVRLRRPAIVFDDSRTCLAIRDQDGVPAGRVQVVIGEVARESSREGLLVTEQPFPAGARVWIAGIAMGRVPHAIAPLDEPTVEIFRRR
ncbi:MAG: hypothetical protein P8R54_33340 [Myxococcota bacterium]|nr:hypothetical protein [Myxococcota bacterium]